MKKLIMSLMLVFGIFLTVQAQTLKVRVTNNTPDNWAYKVLEGNGGWLHFAIPPIAPGTTVNGAIPNVAPFPLNWGGQDFDNGCPGASGFLINAVGPGSQGLCGYTVNWNLMQFGVDYFLDVTIQ